MAAAIFTAGAGIALYDWLSSKGQNLTITDNILTDMSISSNFLSETSCSSTVSGSQSINIQPGPPLAPQEKLHGEGSSCLLCVNALAEIQAMRDQLELNASEASHGLYQTQTASEQVTAAMTGGSDDITQIGACELMCSDVVILNVQQSQVFKARTECKVATDVTNNIAQTIQGKIKSSLKNQEDIIGQLEDAFTSNTEAITNNISSRMSQTLVNSVRQTLVNNALSIQNFNAGLESNASGPDGNSAHSIYVNTVSQSFTSNSVAKLNANNQVNNSLRQSADYSISQQLLNKNDTLGDITKDFRNVIDSLGVFLNTLTGDGLIILGSILAILALLIGAVFLFSKRGRDLIEKYVDLKTGVGPTNNYSTSAYTYPSINTYQQPMTPIVIQKPAIETPQPTSFKSNPYDFYF
jgi:hypothetical protein